MGAIDGARAVFGYAVSHNSLIPQGTAQRHFHWSGFVITFNQVGYSRHRRRPQHHPLPSPGTAIDRAALVVGMPALLVVARGADGAAHDRHPRLDRHVAKGTIHAIAHGRYPRDNSTAGDERVWRLMILYA
jgi:hypothetical protein